MCNSNSCRPKGQRIPIKGVSTWHRFRHAHPNAMLTWRHNPDRSYTAPINNWAVSTVVRLVHTVVLAWRYSITHTVLGGLHQWCKLWLTDWGQYASLYRVISEGLTMHAHGYETVSTRIRSGAIVLSNLDVPPGHHALDIIAVSLVTGLLHRLPSRGKYKKVIRCDTCI